MCRWRLVIILAMPLVSASYVQDISFSETPDEGYERWTKPLRRHFGDSNDVSGSPASLGNASSTLVDIIDGPFDANSTSFFGDGAFAEPLKKERFLSIFSLVHFANSPCTVGEQSGTCYTQRECSNLGGTSIGTCARGFGTCCYKEITCGGSTSMNCTYLVSPNYPGTYNEARTCTMSFTRTSRICQLRMDFVAFESTSPSALGVCSDDQFTVSGERKFSYLCGTAPSNWHFYLDVNGKSNPTVFSFATSGTSFNRKFKIKISMIECLQKVPCGCGQYLTGDTGIIQSFNYGSFYLAELDYGICFRKEKNRCTTTFTRAGPTFVSCPDTFKVPVGQTGATTPNNAVDTQNLYCHVNLNTAIPFFAPFASATTFPSPQSSVSNGPIIIWHLTLNDNAPNWHSTANCPECAGFFLTYQTNPC